MDIYNLKEDVVVFDIDGVLARYDFNNGAVKGFSDDAWVEVNMETDIYSTTHPTKLFTKFIDDKDPEELFILSVASSNFEQANKIKFINKHFPNIKNHNIFFVASGKYKKNILLQMRDMFKNSKKEKRVVLIEDNADSMLDVELLNKTDIRCFHVSDFI